MGARNIMWRYWWNKREIFEESERYISKGKEYWAFISRNRVDSTRYYSIFESKWWS